MTARRSSGDAIESVVSRRAFVQRGVAAATLVFYSTASVIE